MTGWMPLRNAYIACWMGLLLACAAALPASEMARPFGEPTPKYMTTTVGFFLRHTQPDPEGGSTIPRLMLNWNSPLFQTSNPGHMRLFFGGTYADGEILLGSNDIVFGVGGFMQPVRLVDREYLQGVEQAGTEVERSSYAGRLMFGTFSQNATYLHNVEILMFYSWGFEEFHSRQRTDPTFVVPRSTGVETWGFSIAFDDAWETKTETAQRQGGMVQAPPEHHGSYLQLMGIFTQRLHWEGWGLPSRFANSNSQADYPKFALASGADQTQMTGDQVNFSFALRAGYGEDLDRFSAFRLGGGTDMDRDLNRAPLYGYHFEEFLADRFATVLFDFGVKFNGLMGTPDGGGPDGARLANSAAENTGTISRFHVYYQQAYMNEMNLGVDQISKKPTWKRAAGTALTTSVMSGVYVRVDLAYGFDARRKNDSVKGGWELVFSAQSSF
ncbi:MAG TPA: hypothetical protein VL860_08245 [Planctomycetota bacterium]|nr:hypothetical protein [Planctomycetota bacterium]